MHISRIPDHDDKIICMISCCHSLLDDRIYKKEALTLARNGYRVVHIGYGEDFKDIYTDDAIRLVQIKKTKIEQCSFSALFQAAKSIAADVYHLHDVELCRIALKLQRLFWQPKVIYDAHEPYNVFLRDSWRARPKGRLFLRDIPAVIAEKRILSKVDYLIATEENVAARFRKKNPHTAIIYNYSYFHPNNSLLNADNKRFDLIYCGSLSETKGIFLMLNAFAEARKRGYAYRMVIVGGFYNPTVRAEIEKMIQKEKLSNHLLFTGELPFEEVSRYYQQSKVAFCLLSSNRTNRLILPIKLFEYAAFGLPVIGSNFGHIAEIIQDNHIGVCVNPHDANEVASALIDLLSGEKYKSYIHQCLHCVRMKYLWKNQEEKLLDIYEQLLGLQDEDSFCLDRPLSNG